MKLRVQDNSIRLRLTRGEVERMARDGRVDAAVGFPGGARLEYSLQASSAAERVEARLDGSHVIVSIPVSDVQEWASTDEVSISASQSLGQDGERGELAILVEKDFECLTPREGEDESDMFPHPLKGQETC